MIKIIFSAFFVLHGLVHLLYFGQSARFFELKPGMIWPDGSWAFSRLIGNAVTRNVAGILLIVATIGFCIGGAGLFLKQAWWRTAVIASVIFSSVIYMLLWDGGFQNLDNKGAIGILINAAILVALTVFRWPSFEF
jgi:hypothetical protein